MFQKNSSILSFELKRIFLNSLLILFIAACGFKPLNYSEKKITIFFEFQKNPLNLSLVQELKKNFQKVEILRNCGPDEKNTNTIHEIPIFTSEDFSYDTESILSNEKQADEIKLDFFSEAVNELLIFFSEKSNAESA